MNQFFIRRYNNEDEFHIEPENGIVYRITMNEEFYEVHKLEDSKLLVGYVGKTTGSQMHERERRHKKANGSCKKLYNALNKYGCENFTWTILEVTQNESMAYEREKYYIDVFNCIEEGLNIREGGKGAGSGEKNHMWKGYIQVKTLDVNKVIFVGQSTIEIAKTVLSTKGKKLNDSHIRKVLRGERHSHGGYIYEYVTQEEYDNFHNQNIKMTP